MAALLPGATDLPGGAIGIGGLVWVLFGACIAAGFLTTLVPLLLASSTLLAVAIHWWAAASAMTLVDLGFDGVLAVAMAISLALLGPGAYSIDARLFGRREITIPRLAQRSMS